MATIIKGVNFPKKARASSVDHPFDSLEVGDMFFLPGKKTCSAVTEANKNEAGKVFAARQYEHEGVQGCGVWRNA